MTELQAFDCLAAYVPATQEKISTTKLLRALVEFAPTDKGRLNICNEIIGCRATGELDSAKLDSMARRYLTHLLFPNPDSAIDETMVEEAKDDWEELHALALRRDGFRSLMTGKLDEEAIYKSLVAGDASVEDTTLTQVAHIVPFDLGKATKAKSGIWDAIASFYGDDLFPELAGSNCNRLSNVLTLGHDEGAYFSKMVCWFEATDTPNNYVVRAQRPIKSAYTMGKVVCFETTDDLLALPDPRYLALHAACAQVIHACGFGEDIRRILEDIEDLAVLPRDGSSDALLFALHRVPVYWLCVGLVWTLGMNSIA